jgi:predicted alpha/beta superfamily hydrolase
MKITALAACCLIGGNLWGDDLAPAPAAAQSPYVLAGTVCRVLPRTVPDRLYKLLIGLPASFAEHPERKYPVILVTDGYWSFQGLDATVGGLAYGKHIPESLLVGISYEGDNLDFGKMRAMDLWHGTLHGYYEGEGHAERFLAMIETQVLPLLERDYRADPAHRYLVGSSAGGLFALYAMLSNPQLFQGYVADSPSITNLWSMERAFAASGRSVDGRVFITSAGNEWPEYRKWIPIFYERMRQHGIVKGGLEYRETPGTRHGAGLPESYMRGLMYVMEPLAPETGASTDQFAEPPGKRSFVVSFWFSKAATPPEAVSSARRDHEAFMAKLIAEKRAQIEALDSAYVPGSAGTLYIDAASRAEVEAMVSEDPVVKAGIITFEVLGE